MDSIVALFLLTMLNLVIHSLNSNKTISMMIIAKMNFQKIQLDYSVWEIVSNEPDIEIIGKKKSKKTSSSMIFIKMNNKKVFLLF